MRAAAWVRATALLVASAAARSRIHEPERHRGRIFEVPHGIDPSRFRPRAAPPSRPSVLFLNSVQYRKGIFTLLDAFPHVARAVPGVELVVAGIGPDLSEVQRRAQIMDGCTIRFAGRVAREQVGDMLRAHSIYCLPSIGEPFGMTMSAAMPRNRAARARAAAWLPEEWVATPRAASASVSEKTALVAPRALKAPIFWRFSHLKKSEPPQAALRRPLVSTGVRCTCGAIRSAAA